MRLDLLDYLTIAAYIVSMVKQVNLYEAKTQLSKLVDEAANGAEILIAKNGKPLAALVPAEKITPRVMRPGFLKGQAWMSPDIEEFEKELSDLMNDGPLFPEDIVDGREKK